MPINVRFNITSLDQDLVLIKYIITLHFKQYKFEIYDSEGITYYNGGDNLLPSMNDLFECSFIDQNIVKLTNMFHSN